MTYHTFGKAAVPAALEIGHLNYSGMLEGFPTAREEFGVRGSAPLWFEQRLSFAMRWLLVHPMRYDPKRRKPPHSKYAPSHSKNKGQSRYYAK